MNATTTYTVRWMDLDTGEEHIRGYAHPLEAVQALSSAQLNINTAPLSITPVPDWSTFSRGAALAEALERVQETAGMPWSLVGAEWLAVGAGLQWSIVHQTDSRKGLFYLSARRAGESGDVFVKRNCTSLEQAQRYALGGVA